MPGLREDSWMFISTSHSTRCLWRTLLYTHRGKKDESEKGKSCLSISVGPQKGLEGPKGTLALPTLSLVASTAAHNLSVFSSYRELIPLTLLH